MLNSCIVHTAIATHIFETVHFILALGYCPALSLSPSLAVITHARVQGIFLDPIPRSYLIAWIHHLPASHEILLDTPHTHKPTQKILATRLVIRPTRPRAAKRLLAHHRTRTLAVNIEIARGVPQRFFRLSDRHFIPGEHGAGESVVRGGVDQLADIEVRVGCRVVIDVDGKDRAEELGGEERMMRVGSEVDGGMDEEPFAVVISTTDQALELLVGFGVIDGLGKLVE